MKGSFEGAYSEEGEAVKDEFEDEEGDGIDTPGNISDEEEEKEDACRDGREKAALATLLGDMFDAILYILFRIVRRFLFFF